MYCEFVHLLMLLFVASSFQLRFEERFLQLVHFFILYFYKDLLVCRVLASFIVGIFNLYEDLYFTYLEINPLGKFIWIPRSRIYLY